MTDQKLRDQFIEALKKADGSAGNVQLRKTLGWDEATYAAVQKTLVDEGAVTRGRGRGGSVNLVGFKSRFAAAFEAELGDIDLASLIQAAQSEPSKPVKAAKQPAPVNFEATLWAAADALRNNMDAAEYKHVVLGLIFLKYISDAFEAKHAELEAQKAAGADPEDPDEYRAASIFWVPKEARWQHLKASAPQPTIGTLVDDAMAAIERDNPDQPPSSGPVGMLVWN